MKILLFLIGFCASAQTVPIKGGVLHYRDFGTGEALLVINGGPGMSSEGFVPLAEKLAFYQRVILFDQRGTGQSKLDVIDSNSVTMELMVRDIEALREHLQIEKWNILGHSFGGMLAAHYADRHPQRIGKLIMSSSGGIDLGLNGYVQEEIDKKLGKTGRDSLHYWTARLDQGENARKGRARALAPAYVYKRENAPIIANRLTQANPQVNALVWQDLRRIGFDHSQSFRHFTSPVLVIQGKNDILKISTAQAIASAFPKSELVLLDKCGHYGWLDRPDSFFPAIEKFLKTN